MCRYVLGIWMICLILGGCKESKSNQESDDSYKSFSEGNYTFDLSYDEQKDSTVLKISLREEEIERKSYVGKVDSHLVADLDQNRKKEIYLVASGEKTVHLFGFQLEGKKAVQIVKGGGNKTIKAGSVVYSVKRNQLIERYQYGTTDRKIQSGESRYNLVKRGDGLILLPQGWQPSELENLLGQYSAKSNSKKGISKTLLIGEREGGKWNVEIEVTNKAGNQELCRFKGLGEFVDRDLYVPMNEIDSTLKGKLKVIFLDGTAIVYTEDKADFEEMATFCSGNGSIAGNYKKLKAEDE